MTPSLCMTPAAEQDLTAAFIWYEEQGTGLGSKFIWQVDDLVARICEMPRQFPEITSGCRRGLLPRFPWGVYFSLESNRVVIHAVLHLHRNPAHWRERLAGGSG